MKRNWFIGVIGIFAGASALAAPEYVPIQEKAQGQSLTGASLLNDSLFSNPASSSFTNVYSVEANGVSKRTFSASILDTKTSGYGGSIGFFRRALPANPASAEPYAQGVKIGLASRATEQIGFGLAGKMIWSPDTVGTDRKLTDIDAGLLGNFDFLQLGLTLRNLFGGNTALDSGRELALGARINYQNTLFFSTSALSKWERMKPYQYGFGAEYVTPWYFGLKGGYWFQPDTKLAAWTAGLSILSPRVSFHYAVEFPNTASTSPEHQFGMTLLF